MMVAELLKPYNFLKDEDFDQIFPTHVRQLSKLHFTEIEIAVLASEFLAANPNQKILDIGCGAGKFCFVAGSHTDAHYTGVDYRKHFIDLCETLTTQYKFKNVAFSHNDIVNVDFSLYHGFYFFNPFEEHATKRLRLDSSIEVDLQKYVIYSDYVRAQFARLPKGTRIATYYADNNQIPECYRLISTHNNGLLKCWEKTRTEKSNK